MITLLSVLSLVLLAFCAVAYTTFWVRYSCVQWGRTREGRHLMGQSRVLAVILWATLIVALVPVHTPTALAVQVVLFGWLAFEGVRRNHLLTLNQREVADDAADSHH